MYVRPFIGILALVLVGACNRQPAAASQTTAAPAAAPAPKPAQPAAGQPAAAAQAPATPGVQPGPETPKPVPAVLPQVLAKIDGLPVGREELESAVKDAESRAGRAVPPTERDAVYRGLLDRVILFRLLSAEAKVRGITVTPQEITDRIAQIKQQFPSEAEFQKELTKRQHDDGPARGGAAPRPAERQDDRGRSGAARRHHPAGARRPSTRAIPTSSRNPRRCGPATF